MPASLRRSASASAAIAMNSRPRWLISITDMPASCQFTSSHFAFSSTSTGMVAGPAPKLKMRAAGLTGEAAIAALRALEAFLTRGRALAFALRFAAAFPVAVGVAIAVAVAVAVLAVLLVAVLDALEAGELLALAEVDERHALGGAPHLADLVHAR